MALAVFGIQGPRATDKAYYSQDCSLLRGQAKKSPFMTLSGSTGRCKEMICFPACRGWALSILSYFIIRDYEYLNEHMYALLIYIILELFYIIIMHSLTSHGGGYLLFERTQILVHGKRRINACEGPKQVSIVFVWLYNAVSKVLCTSHGKELTWTFFPLDSAQAVTSTEHASTDTSTDTSNSLTMTFFDII